MKKYFLYLISLIIIITSLGAVITSFKKDKSEIFDNFFARAQNGFGGNGFDGFGGNGGNGSSYDLDYDGDCEALYCYSAAPNQPCPDDKKIKENQQKVVSLRDLILYYKNKSLGEAQELNEEDKGIS